MTSTKIEISAEMNQKLSELAALNNLSKKEQLNLILAAYFGEKKARDLLFGFNILNEKLL